MAGEPVIPTLPPAPQRSQGQANYPIIADTWAAAIGPWTVKVNETTVYVNEKATQANTSVEAAAGSAVDAAGSAELAGQRVGLAADQVTLAVTARQGAEAAEAQALVYLQATEAGAGIPPAIPDSFLGTDAEGNPLWKSITIPPAFSVGDILDTSRPLAAPDWLSCNGAAYLQSSYPALFAQIGQATSPFEPPVTVSPGVGMSNVSCIAIGRTGNYVLMGGSISPFIYGYKKSGDALSAVTIGSPGVTVGSVAWSPNDNYLAFTVSSAPYLYVYKRSGDTFSVISPASAVLPPALPTGVAFSPDDNYLAVSHNNTPFMTVYKRSGDVFTKLANPATLPPGTGTTCTAWSPDSVYLVLGSTTDPFIAIYKRTGDVFTKIANPSPALEGYVSAAAFSPDGNYLALGGPGTTLLTIYKRSGDTFTKLANPATLPTYNVISLAFSADGNFLAVAQQGTVGLLYRQAGDVFTKMTTTLGAIAAVSISPDSRYIAGATSATPGITLLKEANYITKTEFVVPTLTPPGTFANIKRYIKA